MEGMVKVFYTVMCKNDVSKEVSLSTLLANEKLVITIRGLFGIFKRFYLWIAKQYGSYLFEDLCKFSVGVYVVLHD